MIFPLGSPLRPAVDAALASMRADGSLAKISAVWFAPTFRAEATPSP
jgi:ABC-type amino acid transport substrate-binding protein